MPIANLKSVFGVSSEDSAYPASNLLSNANKKWKCESPAPSSIFVILQFDKPTKINGIDIGNEHSAFIEAFVGKNGWSPDKFQQILLGTSFMGQPESRNSTSTNGVKCFARNALDATVCEQKWDLIKIVCSQTFNKHVQYGLSFVKVHCVDNGDTKEAVKPTEKAKVEPLLNLPANSVFSKFKIRENTPESDDDTRTTSSLFMKWKQSKATDLDANESITKRSNVSAASAIRDAASSTQTLKKLTAVKAKTKTDSGKRSSTSVRDNEDEETVSKPLDRNRESLLYVDDDLNTSIPKLEKIIDRDKERIRQQQEDAKPKKKPAVNQSSSSNNNSGRAEKKMEASAQKFKTFLSNDIESTPTRDDKKLNGDLNNSLPMAGTSKASTPAKIETKPQTPVQSAKRPSSAHWSMEESSAKKKRPSASETEPLHYKPFGKLLEGVVIVISGIQNPDRADIRDKAQKMGARYKPDWDGSCTHLICAFMNTPKYKEVQKLGKGKIVNRNWVTECFKRKKRIPWRRYALDSNETSQPESDDEIFDLSSKPIGHISLGTPAKDDESKTQEVLKMYDLQVPKSPSIDGSGSDTDIEDYSEHVSQSESKRSYDVPDIYDVSTDDEASKK